MKYYIYLILSFLTLSCSEKISEPYKPTKVSAEQRELLEFSMQTYFESYDYVREECSNNFAVRQECSNNLANISEINSKFNHLHVTLNHLNFTLPVKYRKVFFNVYEQLYFKIMKGDLNDMENMKQKIDLAYKEKIQEFDDEYEYAHSITDIKKLRRFYLKVSAEADM